MTISELWGERFGLGAPRKIICVGLNYRDHAAEGGREAPGEPLLFAKLPTALIEPGEAIVLPPEDDHVDSEAELAVVIGVAGRRIPREAALDHVAGYTVANDVSARTLQRRRRRNGCGPRASTPSAPSSPPSSAPRSSATPPACGSRSG